MNEYQVIKCSGSDPESPHPTIYLKVKDNTGSVCPYCSKKYQNNTPKLEEKTIGG